MAQTDRTKISEYSATADSNINIGTTVEDIRLGEYGTDLDAEAARPQDVNNAIRELMSHLKDMDVGTEPLTSPSLGEPTADVVGLNTAYTEDGNEAEGSLFWNSDEGTADLKQASSILQVGQEMQIYCRNNSGTTAIPDGTPVYAVGTVGASGRITVAPMNNSSGAAIDPKRVLGVATHSIAGGGDGMVTAFGKVRGLDLSATGLVPGGLPSDGAILWVDGGANAGKYTTTIPTAPNLKIAIGYVISASAGDVFVRANAGIDLHNNHRVEVASVADNDLLAWNATNSRWENQSASDAGLQAVLAEGAFVDGDKTKLDGIETNATADQTASEIKTAYESNSDTNAFTDTLLSKLNGIEAGADVTDATNVAAAGAVMDGDYANNTYLVGTATPGTYTQVTDNSTNWNTAYDWGDHSTAGYITNGLQDGGQVSTGLYFQDNANLRVGTGTDLQIKSDGTDVEALLGSGSDLNIQASSTGFTYLSKSGNASSDTPVVGGAKNTYGLAATNGGGVGFSFLSPNGNGVLTAAATIYARYSDVTNGSEDTRVEVLTEVAGTPTTVATFRGDAASTIPGDLSVTGALTQGGNAVLTTADVDDTPVDGATTAPVSSNWAYDHENSTSAHTITSISGLGANVATFLGTPSSANLASAVTDETGSGALVFGTAPTLSQVHDDSTISYNGTDYGIGYRSIPTVSPTGAVTASAAHNGKCITTDDTVTVPSTLAVGTVISVWVNSASTISIAKSGGTMYLNGTSVTSVTAAAYGIATIYFPSSSTMVVTGNVS
jgi:hypothetical protein